MDKEQAYTTTNKAQTYDTTVGLLKAMYMEFKDLSKKKPDAAVSKSKINITNRLLTKVRSVLDDEESIEFLDLLDEDDVPQVSDVTIILSQYEAAMASFRDKYYGFNSSEREHQWYTK
ncbi:MAG: hypothetical protein WAW36_18740 [Methylovulum miyakonense]|uniref:hypothetical protein n=1 Tax=Methylovulum miyakonense TaxID=645578 RepID=UPI003BB672C0